MWRSMIVAALLAFVDCAAAGCGDDDAPPPTCASIGCGSAALCNRRGECTCGGHACVLVAPDAAVSP